MNYLITPKKETVTRIKSINAGWLYLIAGVLSVLKWQGIIAWSWWAVLSPIWVPWLLVALALTVMGLIVLAWLLVLVARTKKP